MDEAAHLRLSRIEAELEIRSLAARYAQAVDARDLLALGDLYDETSDFGKYGSGPDGARARMSEVLAGFYRSVHFVGTQTVTFSSTDANAAQGVAYTRAEHEVGDQWIAVTLRYVDSYVRRSTWKFATRVVQRWYASPVDESPSGPEWIRWHPAGLAVAELPGAWPTWSEFWSAALPGSAHVTSHPVQ